MDDKKIAKEIMMIARGIMVQSKKNIEESAVEFLKKNPKPKDSATHGWAEKNGFEVDDFEATIYELAGKYVGSFLVQGLANKKGVGLKDVDAKELAMGIDVEMEHTNDKKIAEKIALDHLAEIKDYYTRLKKMEAEAEGE